jgi:protein gp37
MNRTQIEWVKNPDGSQGFTWNPITGCLNIENGLCKGGGFPCYAYKLANTRLKQRYLANKKLPPDAPLGRIYDDPFYPRFWEERLEKLNPMGKLKFFPVGGGSKVQPKGFFVCDMGDLFGIGVPEEWTRRVLDIIKFNPNHRFYLLTKQPQNLIKFSPFPENCWVGVTVTNFQGYLKGIGNLATVEASIRFISFEPLLGRINNDTLPSLQASIKEKHFDWLIIGACTGTWQEMAQLCLRCKEHTLTAWGNKWTAQPCIEWVREIVEAADKVGVKVFLKDNLKPIMPCSPRYMRQEGEDDVKLRQEMPSRMEKIPTDCYACWFSAEDRTDGEYCYELERNIQWFRERRSKPLDCPIRVDKRIAQNKEMPGGT